MNRRQIVSGLLALFALPLMGAKECKREDGPTGNDGGIPDPKQPPERGLVRTVLITAYVEDAYCPYVVKAYAYDPATGEHQDFEEPVVSGPFSRVLTYETGHRVQVDVEIRPARVGSEKGYLIVKDGPMNKQTKKIDRGYRANIQLYTAR